MSEAITATNKPWLGLDPFRKGLIKESWVERPALARFLWRLDLGFVIEDIGVDFYIHKPLPDVLELWDESEYGDPGLLGRALVDDSVSEVHQYLDLLFEIFKAWRNYQHPVRMVLPGVLGKPEWQKLKQRMEVELRRKGLEEVEDVHGLLQMALELGLDPVHDGGDSEFFICRCPARHIHHVYMVPATGQWYCGWCVRRGETPDELRAFHEENRN